MAYDNLHRIWTVIVTTIRPIHELLLFVIHLDFITYNRLHCNCRINIALKVNVRTVAVCTGFTINKSIHEL